MFLVTLPGWIFNFIINVTGKNSFTLNTVFSLISVWPQVLEKTQFENLNMKLSYIWTKIQYEIHFFFVKSCAKRYIQLMPRFIKRCLTKNEYLYKAQIRAVVYLNDSRSMLRKGDKNTEGIRKESRS